MMWQEQVTLSAVASKVVDVEVPDNDGCRAEGSNGSRPVTLGNSAFGQSRSRSRRPSKCRPRTGVLMRTRRPVTLRSFER